LCEGERISGQSKLASEYSVSPETIRRAMRLLSDMKVVEIKEQSGVIVLSKDNALRYLKQRGAKEKDEETLTRLRSILVSKAKLSKELITLCEKIIEDKQHPLETCLAISHYEVAVPSNSGVIGHNLSEMQFWTHTGATIIAIKRGDNLIISPGPTAELYERDRIIFVSERDSVEAVTKYLHEPVILPVEQKEERNTK